MCLVDLAVGRFHLCVTRGRLDCLEAIISHGADITVNDGAGMEVHSSVSTWGKILYPLKPYVLFHMCFKCEFNCFI